MLNRAAIRGFLDGLAGPEGLTNTATTLDNRRFERSRRLYIFFCRRAILLLDDYSSLAIADDADAQRKDPRSNALGRRDGRRTPEAGDALRRAAPRRTTTMYNSIFLKK